MIIKEILDCSFQNWYENFKNVTIKSILLPLPDDVVEYLLKDGVILPKNNTIQYTLTANSSEDEDSDQESWNDEYKAEDPETPHFAEFDKSINEGITKLGGKVFPKLNWSSPRDASWIALNNSCCCSSAAEIYLLLKSSEFITHDLTQRFIQCENFDISEAVDGKPKNSGSFYLVLRKWTTIDASGEFRCFVKDHSLIGISQREESLYFDHMRKSKDEILKSILYFFETFIKFKFPCQNYVFDVFLRRRGQVLLMDFNPFGVVTDPLLFTWTELNDGSVNVDEFGLPQFRFISDQNGVKPSTLRQYAVPKDIIDISTGEDSYKLVDLLKAKVDEQNKSNFDASSDEDETWKV